MSTVDKQLKPAWPYPVGQAGSAWTPDGRAAWTGHVGAPTRSYKEEVVDRLHAIAKHEKFSSKFEIVQYGALSHDKERYPLFAVVSRGWADGKKRAAGLVTGGVHGYETSGVQGALLFVQKAVENDVITDAFDFIVAPCVSPWGYEHIQRWTKAAVDPNRSFVESDEGAAGGPQALDAKARGETPARTRGEGRTEESTALLDWMDSLNLRKDGTNVRTATAKEGGFNFHIDLHETTDTDATEFRPAKMARDGESGFDWEKEKLIPLGFYLVCDGGNAGSAGILKRLTEAQGASEAGAAEGDDGDAETMQQRRAFAKTVLDAVEKVTKICPDDEILGCAAGPKGGIFVPAKSLGLCGSLSNAEWTGTTEVYPDMPGVGDDECNRAQCAAVCGAMEWVGSDKKFLAAALGL